MKKLVLMLAFVLVWTTNVHSQDIYGFSWNMFASTNIYNNTIDTLIVFSQVVPIGDQSAIDRFNGRYFVGSSIAGYEGNFHIIDLIDLSIESYDISLGEVEYDFIRNRLLYDKGGIFYSLDLSTFEETNLGQIEYYSGYITTKTRTYVPQSNQYFHISYIYGSQQGGDPYYLMIDGDSGEIVCQEVPELIYGVYYGAGQVVTNNLTGDIIGYSNSGYGIVDACEGTMTHLSTIPDYWGHLNSQMPVYNHSNNTYIIPYTSTNPNDPYKIAIIDVYNDEVLQTMSQPWDGWMNSQQIYDQPVAPLIYLNDTLFVPQGQGYKWFLDDTLIGETDTNYWIPVESGTYVAEVEFREYTTHSTKQQIIVTSIEDEVLSTNLKVFPNPASESIKIDFPNNQSAHIRVVTLAGKVIHEVFTNNTSTIQIKLNDFPKGVYLITFETDENYFTELMTKF